MDKKMQANLLKIEKAVVKLINKQKRADLNYTVQASVSSVVPGKITYAAQITPMAEGLAPMTFINDTAEELVENIKTRTKEIDQVAIEKAYHAAQIVHGQRAIKHHEERIVELDNPTTEVEE